MLAGLAARLAIRTPAGRAFIAARLDGLTLGPIGRLHIEGLDGDAGREFSLRRLAILDAHGIWLDARGVRVRWQWPALLARRVRVDLIVADSVLISRTPVLAAGGVGPSGAMPVSVVLDDIRFRLETLPAISVKRGLFQVAGRLDVERRGGLGGELHGRSLLRPGDALDSRFNFGLNKRLLLDAQAREAQGGAIAGLAGLPADRTFVLAAKADGAPDHGQLHLKVLSGADSVAQIDGGWTRASGAGQGRVSLAASRWTAGWMRAFGPEVRLAGRGRGLDGARYDLSLKAASDNATFALGGVIDANTQSSSKGLKAQANVNDLSRIVSEPVMGRGALSGILSGQVGNWRLAGEVSIERLAVAGYSLGRAAGPAELAYAKQEWRLKTNLAGTGGQGQGLAAALAGAAPRASLEAVRFVDGRLLLRSLNAVGAGLKLEASGERSLFGGLTIKGRTQVSNLAAARTGAHGAIDGRWSASQGRAGGAWAFNAEAAGSDLASGQEQLDRLLGPKPALNLAATYDKGAISVSRALLVGTAARMSGAGQIGKAGELKLTLDWSASGPFAAGPLQIVGQAKGAGVVGGTIAEPRADLLADFERVELPRLTLKPAHVVLSLVHTPGGVDGLVSIAANSDYGLAHGRAGLHVAADGLSLTDLDAAAGGASATGSLTLRNSAPASADLTIAVGPGAFLTQGRAQARVKILDQAGGAVGDVRLTADDLVARDSSMTIAQARFSAKGPLAHLPYSLSAVASSEDWPVKLDGSGVLSQTAQGYGASFSGSGRVRHADFRTLSPAMIDVEGPHRTARLDLAVGGGQAEISVNQTDQTMGAKAALSGVDLAALGEDIAGKVTANIAVSGAGQDLGGVLDARVFGARGRDAPAKLALDGSVHATLVGSRINLDATASGATSGDRVNVSLALPAEASAAPFRVALARARPIEGRFDANGELQPIWDLFFGGEQSLSGALTARGGIGGTLDAPKLTGHASLASGRFEELHDRAEAA